MRAAVEAGDRHPSLIKHAAGTRFAANLISSQDLVFDWSWAYLIAIRGHFKLRHFHGPPGARAPHGTVITMVLDAKTRQGEDGGVSNHYPDLARLGPVTTDYRR